MEAVHPLSRARRLAVRGGLLLAVAACITAATWGAFRHGVEPGPPALHTLIGQGFHLAVAERTEDENADGEGLITHSDRFVLVDPDLQIRGYYHGTDEDALTQLQRDIATLAAGPKT